MRVLVAPQKVDTGVQHAFDSIRSMRPRVAGLTELDLGPRSYVAQLARTLGRFYRVLSKDKGRHSQEIPVALRVGLGLFCKVLSFDLFTLSPDVGEKGTGNDRWLAIVRFKLWRRVYVVLHTHTNAVIQNHDPHSPNFGRMLSNERVPVTAAAMQTIEARLAEALADPEVDGRVLLTGDLNYLPVARADEWEHSPQAICRRLGMKWRNSRVVYLCWGPGLELEELHTIPAHSPRNPADHGWLLGILRRRRAT